MAAYLVEVAGGFVGAGADLAGGCGAAPFGKRMILKPDAFASPNGSPVVTRSPRRDDSPVAAEEGNPAPTTAGMARLMSGTSRTWSDPFRTRPAESAVSVADYVSNEKGHNEKQQPPFKSHTPSPYRSG